MTSANSLSLILRRLHEIERKLNRMLEELRTLNTPTAIGYSVPRANLPKNDCRKELAPGYSAALVEPRPKGANLAPMNPGRGQSDQEAFGSKVMQSGKAEF